MAIKKSIKLRLQVQIAFLEEVENIHANKMESRAVQYYQRTEILAAIYE
jgi:hypothetical protein